MSDKVKTAISTSIVSIVGNTLLALTKGLIGVFGHSYALIADAIESTTDIFASILVLVGIKYANKPADENHPYGHGKLEPLITFAVVGFLLISATIIFIESIHNIQRPHESPKAFTLIFLGGIIIFKEISYRFVNRKSQETNSTSLKADAWHHRSDAITSLMAFIGISIGVYMGHGYETADDWAALFASLIIVYNAFMIFRPALGEIMDEHLHDHLLDDIRRISLEINGVKGTEKCHIRKMGMNYYVDLHLIVDANSTVQEGHNIAHQVKDRIKEFIPEILDVLIHVEPHVCP